MAVFALCKAGYGTIAEIERFDSATFLDLIEYENISNDIQTYLLKGARNGNN